MLSLARQAVEASVMSTAMPMLNLNAVPEYLCEPRACFVTLYKNGELRGCTGVLVARSPLLQEIIHTSTQTALADPRFTPVQPDEVSALNVEISILTPPVRISISSPSDILKRIRPGIDGVTLIKGPYRATFLPQVWERVPEPTAFLDLLCQKMGLPRRAWLFTLMDVETYQAEEISEATLDTHIRY
jgi:AmmeMemoRadiSam system protein A